MEIKIVGEDGEVKEASAPMEMKAPGGLDSPVELGVINVAQMLDMDLDEMAKYEDKIKDLIDWGKTQVDDPTMQNIKIALRNLESRLGSPGLGEHRILKMHRFAYLELQEHKLKKEKELMYG